MVDTRIDFNVTELGGTATQTTPGQVNVVTRFQLTNTGNSTQGYVLSVANEAGTVLFTQTDNQDVNNLRIFVDSNGNGAYDAGTDTATNINSLITDADGESVVVFVVADIPVAATNNQYANVRLTARATPVGSTTPLAQTTGPDTAGVDVVWADAGRDNSESAADQYHIQSAALTLAKTAAVVCDPFNRTSRPQGDSGRARRVHDHRDQRQHDDGGGRRDRDRQHSGEHHVPAGQHHAERGRVCRTRTSRRLRRREWWSMPAPWLRTAARRRSRSV